MKIVKYLYDKLFEIWSKKSFIGFIILCIFFWFRFFRERLPKDLPLILTNETLFFLVFFLISLFTSMILILSNQFNIKFFKLKNNIIIFQLKESLYKFDHNIKKYINKELKVDLQQLHLNFFNYLRLNKAKKKYIYFFFILPKIILPIVLFIEIFVIGHIYYFYKLIILLALPLIYNYIYYSLHWFYIEQIEAMETILEIRVAEDNTIVKPHFVLFENIHNSCHYYIQEYALDIMHVKKNKNIFDVQLKNIFIKTYLYNKTENEISIFYNNFCKNSFLSCIKLFEVLYIYTMLEKKFSFYINFYMIFVYFVCWTYVLFTANYAYISFDYLFNINDSLIYEEPFSGLGLNLYEQFK